MEFDSPGCLFQADLIFYDQAKDKIISGLKNIAQICKNQVMETPQFNKLNRFILDYNFKVCAPKLLSPKNIKLNFLKNLDKTFFGPTISSDAHILPTNF